VGSRVRDRESHWLDGALSLALLLACVAAGHVVVSTKAGPDAFSQADRSELEMYWPGGTYLNASTYRLCFEGRYWYFRSDGARYDAAEKCWR